MPIFRYQAERHLHHFVFPFSDLQKCRSECKLLKNALLKIRTVCKYKLLQKKAKPIQNQDFFAFHIHERSEVNDEMAKDEARHGKAFAGLLKRYFGK